MCVSYCQVACLQLVLELPHLPRPTDETPFSHMSGGQGAEEVSECRVGLHEVVEARDDRDLLDGFMEIIELLPFAVVLVHHPERGQYTVRDLAGREHR